MTATGITVGGGDREDLFDYVTLAETEGIESVWVGESWGSASVPAMTQLLERTDTIDVCSGIFNIYSRTPGLVAMTANTLADIGNGRFRVGIGASGPAVIENFHGAEFEAPLRRTREYIETVRGFLRGDRVEYEGEFFDLSGFQLDVDTYHECPIYVAAMGETNRQLSGEFADGWMPFILPSSGLDDALEAVHRGASRGDREPDAIDVAPWVPTCISETEPEAARQHAASVVGFYVGAMGDYYANAVTNFGFGEEADAIQAGWADDGPAGAAAAVTDEMVDAFCAAGTPAQAAESFDRFGAAGADSPVAYLPAQSAPEEMLRETVGHL
jgi:coenzyme F420-dependent oxidoreductase